MPRSLHTLYGKTYNCFFITTGCYELRHLLIDSTCFDIILDNFRFYNQKYDAHLVAYCLMISHIHFIVYFEKTDILSNYMRDFKKYSSVQLRNYLKQYYPELYYQQQYIYRQQEFKIWEDGYDDLAIYTRKVCETKLNYIHNNPLEAGLVTTPEAYKYSSASFYYAAKPVNSQLLHYKELF
jgi:putative transposase